MATADKLTTVAENVPKVYHAGQMNVVENAECLKGSKSDTAILLDDVSPVTHEMGVKVKGKNLITFPYTYAGNTYGVGDTYTHNGVTFTVNADRSITANGTAGEDATEALFNFFNATGTWLANGDNPITVTLSGCPSGGSFNSYFLAQSNHWFADVGNGTTFKTGEYTRGYGIAIKSGTTVENLVFKPQLELGNTVTEYTPYVSDITAVKVSRLGKNLFNISSSRGFESAYAGITNTINGNEITVTATAGRTVNLLLGTLLKGTYTLSLNTSIKRTLMIQYGESISSLTRIDGYDFNSSHTFSISETRKIWLTTFFGAGETVIFTDIQLELGSTATDYEPYKEYADYTPNADGTVNGVTSLYPNTTLTTDTEGVIINCEYIKDIDKAYNKLSAEIALSGGE